MKYQLKMMHPTLPLTASLETATKFPLSYVRFEMSMNILEKISNLIFLSLQSNFDRLKCKDGNVQ